MSRSVIRILPAGPEDEAELRALLRAQSMPGWIRLCFEREPDYFAASNIEGERHDVLLARRYGTVDRTAPLIAICALAVRRVFVNGERQRLGYVGQFRTLGSEGSGWRGYRLLRQGFEAVQGLHRDDELPYDITSILSDNDAARRLLSAGLKGMPAYHRVEQLNTLVYRCGGRSDGKAGTEVEPGSKVGLAAIADCLQRNYRRYQFAPVWDEVALTVSGLRAEDFLVISEGAKVSACVALWDQRPVRQMLVRGYRRPIGWFRPLINLAAPSLGMPALPRPGETLRQAWLSHLACDRDDPEALAVLLPAALARAGQLGLEQLFLGLGDRHPLLAAACGARRHLVYRSDIYLVHWPGSDAPGQEGYEQLMSRPVLLEAATL